MSLVLLKLAGILAGIILLFWGVWASFEATNRKLSLIGAICAPLGLVLALLSVLVLCVPGFFRW